MQNFIHITEGYIQFFSGYKLELHIATLIVTLVVATTIDVREHRIPNWLVATGLLIGVSYHAFHPSGAGAVFAAKGMAVGMIALMPLYALGTMGAGDVKLMAMVGSYLGTAAVLSAVLATLVAGGILALGASAYMRALPQLMSNLRLMLIQQHIRHLGGSVAGEASHVSVGKLPYAVAIAAGTAWQIFWIRGA